MATKAKNPRFEGENWQYSIVELNASHYPGIDVYECDEDDVEVSHITPEEVMASQNRQHNLMPETYDYPRNEVEFQNNLQTTDLQICDQEDQSNHTGRPNCTF